LGVGAGADVAGSGLARGGKVPFGFWLVEDADGEAKLVKHEAEQEVIREMVRMRTVMRLPLRTIVKAMAAKGHRISHQAVANIVKAAASGREAA
jgi:hypothetical protein